MRKVVCAAIRSANGHLILGVRHYDLLMIKTLDNTKDPDEFLHRIGDDQGFIDNLGQYLTREEAYEVAAAAGQLTPNLRCLYSEDLY